MIACRATDVETRQVVDLEYTHCRVTGHGSFGVVISADLIKGGKGKIALKRTRQVRSTKGGPLRGAKIADLLDVLTGQEVQGALEVCSCKFHH